MRIAYVTETYPPEINGVSLTVARTVAFLRQQGHQLELIRPRQRDEPTRDDAQEWRTGGLPIPLYPDLRFGLAQTATLRRRFESTRPQLVHVATQGPLGRAAAEAAKALHLPLTADFRTNFHSYSRYYHLGWLEPVVRRYLRNFHQLADRNFVPSRALRTELAAQGFQRLEVIGRGVDPERFRPTRRSDALRQSWGASDDSDLVMLYVGRLAREKNVSLALSAFDMVRYLRPRTRMIVVGDGPMRRELEAEFPAARFVGVQRGEALAAHYASADLFVFPSLSETFGNVTLEAMASGLAVIAFDVAAVAEHISHGDNGITVTPGDESAFVQTVCRTAAAGETLGPLRARARETALAASWETVLTRFEASLLNTATPKLPEQAPHVVLA